MPGLRIVAVEEHFGRREMRDAWSRLDPAWQDHRRKLFGEGAFDAQLDDLADARIRRMDASGVDAAVLSRTTPGVQSLDAADAVPLARCANDLVAQAVRAPPAGSKASQRCRRPRRNVEAGAEHIAQDELGQPHDVAALTAFLASNEAAFINGASITIDGARMADL